MNREDAHRLIRRAAGDALPKEGDSLILDRTGAFVFRPFGRAITTDVSSSYSVEGRDVVILGTGGAGGITISLPPASICQFRVLVVKKIDAGAGYVTVDPDGSETIDGNSSIDLENQWDSIMIVSDGSNWYKV